MNSKRQTNYKRELGPPNKRPRGGEETLNVTKRSAGMIAPADKRRPVDGSHRAATFSKTDPSKANAKERQKAKRILKIHTKFPLTEDKAFSREHFLRIQESVEWARTLLPDFERKYKSIEALRENLVVKLQMPSQKVPPTNPVAIHDQPNVSSMMEARSPMLNHTKPLAIQLKKSFAEIARGRKLIGLIDHGNFDGKIPRDQWDWIQASLTSVALEVLQENPGPPPSCRDAGWFQGNYKLIACDNDRSEFLYKIAVSKVGEVYPGAQLKVVDIVEVPSRPWATAWLPESPSESADILEMLCSMNPILPIEGWKVIKADRFERAMMLVIFQITHASIEHLSRCDGLLNYGNNKIRMQFYTTPHDALSNLEALAAAVDPPSDDDALEINQFHLNEDLSFLSDHRDSLD